MIFPFFWVEGQKYQETKIRRASQFGHYRESNVAGECFCFQLQFWKLLTVGTLTSIVQKCIFFSQYNLLLYTRVSRIRFHLGQKFIGNICRVVYLCKVTRKSEFSSMIIDTVFLSRVRFSSCNCSKNFQLDNLGFTNLTRMGRISTLPRLALIAFFI